MRIVVMMLLAIVVTGCATHWVKRQETETILYLEASDAGEVVFYSSMNRFVPLRAERGQRGVWQVVLPADEACRYFYRVDGEVVIPSCQQREFDDFGGETCVYDPKVWGRGGAK